MVKEESESGVTAPAVGVRTYRRGQIAALVAAALVIVGAAAWLLPRLDRRPHAPAPMRPVALTSLTGWEFYPTSRLMANRWRSHGTGRSRTTGTYVTFGVLGRASAHERSGRRCQADVVARRAPDRVRSATSRRFYHSPRLAARRRGKTSGRLQRRRFTGLVTGWSVAGGRELRTPELRLSIPCSAAPRWQGTARHLPGFRRGRRRAATDCLELESCRFEAGVFARRPAPRTSPATLPRWA